MMTSGAHLRIHRLAAGSCATVTSIPAAESTPARRPWTSCLGVEGATSTAVRSPCDRRRSARNATISSIPLTSRELVARRQRGASGCSSISLAWTRRIEAEQTRVECGAVFRRATRLLRLGAGATSHRRGRPSIASSRQMRRHRVADAPDGGRDARTHACLLSLERSIAQNPRNAHVVRLPLSLPLVHRRGCSSCRLCPLHPKINAGRHRLLARR